MTAKYNLTHLLVAIVGSAFVLDLEGAERTSNNKINSGVKERAAASRFRNSQLPTAGIPTVETVLGESKPVPVARATRADEEERSESQGQDQTLDALLPNTMDGLNDKRLLTTGDRLSFKVVEDEGVARSLTVTDSYEIDVPYIGRVSVKNKTCKQFALSVKRLLEREYYYQATVIVGLDSAGSSARAVSRGKVYVMGQVRSQGALDIPADEVFTVTNAILRAGGWGPYADKKKVRLVRGAKSGNSSKPQIINCVDILDKAQWDKDVEVNPGDIITVPEKLINLF